MQSSTPSRTATTRRSNNNHNNNNNTKSRIMTMTRATTACNRTMAVRGASGSIFVSIALLLLVAFSGNMKAVSVAAATATGIGITAEETVNNTNTRTHLRHAAAGDSVTVADEAVTTAAMTLRTNTAATVAVVQSSPRAQLAQTKYLRFVANVLLDDEGGSGGNGGRGTDSSGSLGGLGGLGGGLGGSGSNLVPIKSAAAAVAASVTAKAFNDSLASEVLSTSASESTAEWTTHRAFIIVKCFVIILIILAAILGNVLVIVSVCRHRKLRHSPIPSDTVKCVFECHNAKWQTEHTSQFGAELPSIPQQIRLFSFSKRQGI